MRISAYILMILVSLSIPIGCAKVRWDVCRAEGHSKSFCFFLVSR